MSATDIRRLAVGEAAPDVPLRGPDGADLQLSSLWRTGPAVLIFLRHFG